MKPASVVASVGAAPRRAAPLAHSQAPQPRSVGRGWPVPVTEFGYVGGGLEGEGQQAAWDGQAPDGRRAARARSLHDARTSTRTARSGRIPRYFRCNSPSTLQAMWGADATTARVMIGTAPPGSASWGHCEIDYPREAIVSPYPFKTAQEHYEALLAETKANGGPTVYTRENPPPDWNGRYSRAISLAFVREASRKNVRSARVPGRAAAVVLHVDQSDLDDPVAADAGVPAAHGADALPPVREQRAAVAGAILLAGRVHAIVLAPGASLHGLRHDAGARAAHGEQRGELHPPLQRRAQVRAERRRAAAGRRTCRAGSARASHSGTAIR